MPAPRSTTCSPLIQRAAKAPPRDRGGHLPRLFKNHFTDTTLSLLEELAAVAELPEHIVALFAGAPVNRSTACPALRRAGAARRSMPPSAAR
ncbi:MAG: hypothetical protein IPH23_11395 [Gammaproteobacteria bacterium]|nr:hypothetical protein [Gammaproteobacteria bacterium]